MFCSKCGNQLLEGALFCQKCGAKVYGADNIQVQSPVFAVNDKEDIDELNITLIEVGRFKVAVIKLIREWLGIGLKESKDIVDKAPILLSKTIAREEAEAMKIAFIKVGASVIFTDQRGESVDVIVHCETCGAILDDVNNACKSCGSVLGIKATHKKKSDQDYEASHDSINWQEIINEIKEKMGIWFDQFKALPNIWKVFVALGILLVIGIGIFILSRVLRLIFSSIISLLVTIVGGYIAFQYWGAKYITEIIYASKSKKLQLPEGMNAQNLLEALSGKFNYPYFKGVRYGEKGECVIDGQYSGYPVIFDSANTAYLTYDPKCDTKKYRMVLLENLAICSYINKFFNPTLPIDVTKNIKRMKSVEKQRKGVSIVLLVAVVFICLAIGLRDDSTGNLQHGNIAKFDRAYYLQNAVSVKDFLRNPDNNSPCYFERYVVDSVPEERIYICKNDSGSSWIVIDDRTKSLESNALQGDMVTVYGKYSDITEIVLSDGSIGQVPVIHADKLIDNSVLPENQEEFFNQVIKSMNSSDTVYGIGSEYYGEYNAKLVVGVDYFWWEDQDMLLYVEVTDEAYGYRINPVDGYFITFILDFDKEVVDPYQNGAIKDEDLTIDSNSRKGVNIPLYANGTITDIEIAGSNGIHDANDLMRGTVRITFNIDSLEAYE